MIRGVDVKEGIVLQVGVDQLLPELSYLVCVTGGCVLNGNIHISPGQHCIKHQSFTRNLMIEKWIGNQVPSSHNPQNLLGFGPMRNSTIYVNT